MIRIFFILFTAILLIACNEEVEKPKDLISREEMKSVMKDLYIYKQISTYKLDNDLPDIAKVNIAVLDAHDLTVDQFKTAFDYYVIHDAAYDELLTEIKTELQAELPHSLNDSIVQEQP